jgi:hypothetical protein
VVRRKSSLLRRLTQQKPEPCKTPASASFLWYVCTRTQPFEPERIIAEQQSISQHPSAIITHQEAVYNVKHLPIHPVNHAPFCCKHLTAPTSVKYTTMLSIQRTLKLLPSTGYTQILNITSASKSISTSETTSRGACGCKPAQLCSSV